MAIPLAIGDDGPEIYRIHADAELPQRHSQRAVEVQNRRARRTDGGHFRVWRSCGDAIDDDDPAGIRFAEHVDRGSNHVKDAVYLYLKLIGPRRWHCVQDAASHPGTSVRHNAVDSPKMVSGVTYQLGHLRCVQNITFMEQQAPSRLTVKMVPGCIKRLSVPRAGGDRRPFRKQKFNYRLADAPASACHKKRAPSQLEIHGINRDCEVPTCVSAETVTPSSVEDDCGLGQWTLSPRR